MNVLIDPKGQDVTDLERTLVGVVLDLYHTTLLQTDAIIALTRLVYASKGEDLKVDGMSSGSAKVTEEKLAKVNAYARMAFPQHSIRVTDDSDEGEPTTTTISR